MGWGLHICASIQAFDFLSASILKVINCKKKKNYLKVDSTWTVCFKPKCSTFTEVGLGYLEGSKLLRSSLFQKLFVFAIHSRIRS